MWHAYILKCSDNSLYTGVTTDVSRRVKEHNSGKGGSYTRSHLPVKLLYQENHSTRSKALKREIQIKRLPRSQKLSLIENNKKILKKF
ncbi:MAG: GIY-YIG nuclease family protein [Candidatus Omnitrophota bacterium]|jgi:putative endonuclease